MTHEPATFLLVPCATCQHVELAARALDAAQRLIWCCARCDQPLDVTDPRARWCSLEELVAHGYPLLDQVEEPRHGEEGGCRGGTCGVQQPSDASR